MFNELAIKNTQNDPKKILHITLLQQILNMSHVD